MLQHPPPPEYCRLCVKSCNDDQHSLYDERGQANANHDLVSKYFTNAMLNMEWERRLQYICGKCWQHILEFHQFQESIIEAQKGQHLHIEEAKEVVEVKIKTELNVNQQKVQLDLPMTKGLGASTEYLIEPTVLTFDIKSEDPLDLNSDYDGMSSPDGQDNLTDEEMSPMMSSRKENPSLQNDDESNEDYSSNDDLPLSSLGQTNLCSSDKKVLCTKKSVEEFDELVALWRSSLECDICHQLVATYSQLKEHFSKSHAPEICYLMCCQLRLETRYDIDRHIRYHNAPQQLKCEACCKTYCRVRYLRDHKRKFHSSKGKDNNAKDSKKSGGKYCCVKCSKDFATEKHLIQHNRDVHKPKIFECNFCEKSFMRPIALRQHLASHTGEKPHTCPFCPKAFTWQGDFSLHLSKSHLQEWTKSAPREMMKGYRRETRGNCMVYICLKCSLEYDNQYSMYGHLQLCRRDVGQTKSKKGFRLEIRGESKVYVCTYCSKEYDKRVAIVNHTRGCQRDTEQKEPKKGYRHEIRGKNMVYVCRSCSQEYKNRSTMHKHVRLCQGIERPIQLNKGYRRETRGESMVCVCSFCSKEYAKMQSMRSHLYRCHRDESSLAKQAPPMPAVQQQPFHGQGTRVSQDSLNAWIIGPSTIDVANITPDGYNLNGKEVEEDSLMGPIKGNELKGDENASKTNVKTEQLAAGTIAFDEYQMSHEFENATWKSEEFLKSEQEFMEL
uniref:Uncharacterized protein n=1 Tax=Stomoxys calcitrans TaxID=35570 RepID=A0A1I8P2X8_STOCA